MNKYSVTHTLLDTGSGYPSTTIHDFITKDHNCFRHILLHSYSAISAEVGTEIAEDILINYLYEILGKASSLPSDNEGDDEWLT